MTGTDSVVLVVAKREEFARLYQVWLQEEGYSVEFAPSDDPPVTAPREPFDAVILDREVSATDDPSVIEVARAGDDDRPIILITTLDSVFEVIDLRFDDYVLKPASKADLVGALTRVLHRGEYGQAVQEFGRSVVTIALIRQGTTVEERSTNDAYGALVDRFLQLFAETGETVSQLDDEELGAVFGDDRVPLVHQPTAMIDVQTNSQRNSND